MATVSGGRSVPQYLRINLGGEAEFPDVINQQPKWRTLSVAAAQTARPLQELLREGNPFLFCDNQALPFPDSSVDEVLTNDVPLDKDTHLGPGISSSEIRRILKSGARWVANGETEFTKP